MNVAWRQRFQVTACLPPGVLRKMRVGAFADRKAVCCRAAVRRVLAKVCSRRQMHRLRSGRTGAISLSRSKSGQRQHTA